VLSLPLQPAALIGRTAELADLTDLLVDQRARLVTLIGPGGTGKTRLALAVADAVAGSFADGVAFVDLTGLPRGAADPVWMETARALGLADDSDHDAFDAVLRHLAQRRLLMLLDNLEHVLDAAAGVSRLLDSCPEVSVLATSREPLRLRWERTYAVPPLVGLPAVTLFDERARAVEPSFALDDQTVPIVTELCERLDGLPLAIELAAARSRVLSPRAILSRLERRLSLLTSKAADRPERHQTLRATIAWSYELLDVFDQQLFRSISVFAGSFTPEAVAAVLGQAEPIDALVGLSHMAERSLLRVEGEVSGEPRFSMLETLREFALERLHEAGEYAAVARRHAVYFLGLVEGAEVDSPGQGDSRWLGQLEDEYDNLRTALRWSLSDADPTAPEIALRLSGGLWRFWWVRGYVGEGTRWLRDALARAGSSPSITRASALHAAGKLARERGDLDEAEALCRESLAIFRDHDDVPSVALVLNSLANVVGDRGDYPGATQLYEQSLALRRQQDDRSGIALALHNLSAIARVAGDLERARALGAEGWATFRAAGDQWGIAISMVNTARIALLSGDAHVAQDLSGQSLRLRQELGDRQGLIRCLEIVAEVAIATGRLQRAARLLGAIEALRVEMGLGLPLDERAAHDRQLAEVRGRLPEPQMSAAWSAGREMDTVRAIAYALSTEPELDPPLATMQANTGPLSQREVEVARLVARGLTNRQIADELIISKWTADNHVGNILRKLNLVGRAQVAAWLAERGLLEGVPTG